MFPARRSHLRIHASPVCHAYTTTLHQFIRVDKIHTPPQPPGETISEELIYLSIQKDGTNPEPPKAYTHTPYNTQKRKPLQRKDQAAMRPNNSALSNPTQATYRPRHDFPRYEAHRLGTSALHVLCLVLRLCL